jgi:hypothetical protein
MAATILIALAAQAAAACCIVAAPPPPVHGGATPPLVPPPPFVAGSPRSDAEIRRMRAAQALAAGETPAARDFRRSARPLIARIEADPNFAGLVFRNGANPHAIVLFTGDAAARLRRYTADPRYRPMRAGLTEAQLRGLQNSFAAELKRLGIHSAVSSTDTLANQAVFIVSESDKYRRAVAEGRLRPGPHVRIVADRRANAAGPQRAGAVLHFPQFRYPAGHSGEALLGGVLEVRNGCLAVGDAVILWPSHARLSLGADGVPVVSGGDGAPLRVGEAVRMGGGEPWTNFAGEGLLEPVPAACSGPLWRAGAF